MPHAPEQVSPHGRRRQPAHDPLIGTMLDDRFLIEERIATGGFGVIYRARTRGGELVAVKVLHPRLIGDPKMAARFRREGATLMQLHDPHTVTTLAAGEARDGTLYIAMELLSGESLHERLRRDGALAWPTAVAIARAVCSSLAEAHALGLVHRDLKPENIHIEARSDGSGGVKVIDFGIVKIARGSAIDDGKELTSAGFMIGTYEYMSPEQIVGSPCRDLSDIYSLGVVTYQMLTGRRPFAYATGPASMMAALLTRTPAPPSMLAAIPPELDRIVMRCLERDPHARFSNIGELADAFDRLCARHPPHHEGATLKPPGRGPARGERFPSMNPEDPGDPGDPGAVLLDAERTWIHPVRREGRTIAKAARSHATTECARPWAMPMVEALGAAAARPKRIATSTGLVTPRPPAHHPGAPSGRGPVASRRTGGDQRGSDPLFTTLPGIAVATQPRITRDVHPGSPALPAPHPVVPLGPPPAPEARTGIPAPAIPLERLASGSGPQRPARSYGALWVALVIVCVAAIALAAAHSPIA